VKSASGQVRNGTNAVGSGEMKQRKRSSGRRRALVQYSSGRSNVVTERSASVMIQIFSVSVT
jgi:hypothetical protein